MKLYIRFILLSFCIGINFAYSQDTFTIADGMIVETTGGVYIELAGDLVETGTGYLKGKVSSGIRTSTTNFAGLTMSEGMDGTIIRNTGSEYNKGNGEGPNMLRYYEMNNTDKDIKPNINVEYVASGTYDERNGLSSPYYIYNYDNPAWTGYSNGVTSSPLSENSVSISGGISDLVFSDQEFCKTIGVCDECTSGSIIYNTATGKFNFCEDGHWVEK